MIRDDLLMYHLMFPICCAQCKITHLYYSRALSPYLLIRVFITMDLCWSSLPVCLSEIKIEESTTIEGTAVAETGIETKQTKVEKPEKKV